jgi:hypothetical protein
MQHLWIPSEAELARAGAELPPPEWKFGRRWQASFGNRVIEFTAKAALDARTLTFVWWWEVDRAYYR